MDGPQNTLVKILTFDFTIASGAKLVKNSIVQAIQMKHLSRRCEHYTQSTVMVMMLIALIQMSVVESCRVTVIAQQENVSANQAGMDMIVLNVAKVMAL
jgi:hypothetical protein